MTKHEGKLYLLDFGDVIKIGYTTDIKNRAYQIALTMDRKINFDKSYYWPMSPTVAQGLEASLLNKYKECRSNHDFSKREIFPSHIKDEIRKDISGFVQYFNFPYKELVLSEVLTGYYVNEVYKIQFTGVLNAARGRKKGAKAE